MLSSILRSLTCFVHKLLLPLTAHDRHELIQVHGRIDGDLMR